MADVDRVAHTERLGERREVVGVGVQIVAGPRLARAAVAAAIVRDDSIAAVAEKQHLVVPRVRAQRPAMAEYDRLPAAPVLVIDLRTVFGRNCAHRAPPGGRAGWDAPPGLGVTATRSSGWPPCIAS